MADNGVHALLADRDLLGHAITVGLAYQVDTVDGLGARDIEAIRLIRDRRNLGRAPQTVSSEETEELLLWELDTRTGEGGEELWPTRNRV
jgi:hypothetical protein